VGTQRSGRHSRLPLCVHRLFSVVVQQAELLRVIKFMATSKRTAPQTPRKGTANASNQAGEPPLIKRLVYLVGFALIIVAIVGFTAFALWNDINAQFNAPRHEAKRVAEGVTVERFVTFPEDATDVFPIGMSEGPDGTFYLSRFGNNLLYMVSPRGELSVWKNYAAIGAMATAPDGYLYVISYAEESQKNYGSVQRISPGKAVETLPAIPASKGLPFFAQLAFDPASNLYVTDRERVWVYRPNAPAPEVWWTAAPLGSQRPQLLGIAYDPTQSAMLISDVGTDSLYRVPLTGRDPLVLLRRSQLDIQVITVDGWGRVLLTLWEHDNASLNLLNADGTLLRLADGFRSPTAVVLRDQKAYVVNSDAPGLLQSQGLLRPRAKPPFTIDVVDLAAIFSPR
jgi:hypothetical protein